MKHTRQDLNIMQGWSLEKKIKVSQMKILEWYREYNGQVFTSFSGGKDSTVLLDLARQVCPDIPAVYVDTGLEYPELRDFVKTKDNVIWLRPRYPFTQIIEKYGYPVISKEVSDVISGARKGQPYRLARLNGELLDKDGKKSIYNCEKYKYLLDAPFAVSAEPNIRLLPQLALAGQHSRNGMPPGLLFKLVQRGLFHVVTAPG